MTIKTHIRSCNIQEFCVYDAYISIIWIMDIHHENRIICFHRENSGI